MRKILFIVSLLLTILSFSVASYTLYKYYDFLIILYSLGMGIIFLFIALVFNILKDEL